MTVLEKKLKKKIMERLTEARQAGNYFCSETFHRLEMEPNSFSPKMKMIRLSPGALEYNGPAIYCQD